jgi:predicted Zn-dependent protease
MTLAIKILFLSLSFIALHACSYSKIKWGPYRNAEIAEEQLRKGELSEACESYRLHVEDRLADKDRPEWENPYFYYLIIGDIKLRDNKVKEALASYEFAEAKKIDVQLVSDRYRYVAQWYEKQGKPDLAMEVLKKYRERDPLLFDAVLDRVAREITRKEDEATVQKNQ